MSAPLAKDVGLSDEQCCSEAERGCGTVLLPGVPVVLEEECRAGLISGHGAEWVQGIQSQIWLKCFLKVCMVLAKT